MTTEFSGPKVRKVVLISGPNLKPNLLNSKEENLENAVIERVILK